MRLAQPPEPLLHRMQIVAEGAGVAHFAPATLLCRRRGDTVLMDIDRLQTSRADFRFDRHP